MTALVQPFGNRTIGDVPLLSMDFQNMLNPGETISSAVWTCTLTSGSDSYVGSRVSGAAIINGTAVGQLIDFKTAGVASGNIYEIVCTILTSLNQTLVGDSPISVFASGAQ